MSKQSLLLVDGDTRSLRVLEVSLRKAGFMVTAALSVQDALDKLELHAPDLIISETTFPDGDGFELRRRVRATPEWSEIPFIFLTAEAAIENKIRGLELGVDDYLTKPIYIKEIVTRINILLQKRQRVRFEERRDGRTRFAGRVQDMPVVDVIQTIEISRKSGVIQFVGERGRQAAIYFRDGRVIDAEAGSLQGEDAVYRLLTWGEGEFEVVFRTVRRREVIAMSSQALLMEGMRRLDEWSRLFEQLPPLTHRFEVDTIELAARLGDVPDDNNRILRLVDGKRTLLEVIDASDVGDLECLQAISRLYFEELLLDLDHGLDHGKPPRRDTGKAVALVEIDGPSPISDETSGPVAAEPAADAAASAAWSASGAGGHAEGARAEGARAEAAGDGEFADDGGQDAEGADASTDLPIDVAPVERPLDVEDPDQTPVGPLMGGYRPSSLRLIDEAVAAAQAIEPSLFDDSRNGSQQSPVHGHRSNGVSHAAHAADDHYAHDSTEGALAAAEAARQGHEASVNLRAAEREDSGLRMIGSLGRDRAEASGELAAFGHTRPLRSETARELVTILPRRITRELPIITQELAESLPTPTPTASLLVARPMPALDLGEPTQRVALPGSGVRAASRSRRLLRIMRPVDGGGPGVVAMLLIILAVALAGTAGLLRLRRSTTTVPPPAQLDGVRDAPAAAGSRPPGSSNEPPGSAGDRSPTDGEDRTGSARPSSDDPGEGRGGSGTIGSAGAGAPGGVGQGGARTASAAGSAGALPRAGVGAAGSAKVADGAGAVSGAITRAAAGSPTGTSGGGSRTAGEDSIERGGPGRAGGTAASAAAAEKFSAGASAGTRDATGRLSDGARPTGRVAGAAPAGGTAAAVTASDGAAAGRSADAARAP
ncbi:MAG TPA: DUF4388 domain-containing protein, partial [Kofleriaceae bacterium]|nr:DUF4388 domain-containing protein [Kofleriaceae bacterium]